MNEKELRAAGMYYRPFQDKELRDEYQRAAGLVFKLNSICNNDYVARYGVLRELFGGIGEECTVVSPFHCDFGYNITVGEKLFANVNLVIIDCARVTIGNNVFIGPNVGIYTAGHPLDKERRNQGLEYAYPITIGNNVWIGAQVCVLPGVTIGDNSVIGAGSVVTKSIPANVLAAGNPCRVIRSIENENLPSTPRIHYSGNFTSSGI